MLFLCENAAPIAVAAAVSLMGWLFGGTRGDLLPYVVPWVSAFMLEVIFCFPQRHSYETSYDARERVWSDLRRDPLVWVAIGFLVLLAVPFVNAGLCVSCDAAAIAKGARPEPPIPFIPFCVNRLDHLNVVLWFAVALPTMVAAKHCLARRGKRLVLEMIVWNGVLLAVYGFVQHALGAPGPLWSTSSGLRHPSWGGPFFSTFGYPNMAGDYFTLLFGLSIALWRDRCEQARLKNEQESKEGSRLKVRRTFWRRHFHLIASGILFYAALNTLSRAAIMLATTTAVIYFLHAFVSFLSRLHRGRRAWAAFWSILGMTLLVVFSTNFTPDDIKRELDSVDTEAVLDRVSSRQARQVRVASDLWKDHPIFGIGGWGFKHFYYRKMTKSELRTMGDIGGINVHNDYMQFLAEHGLVGFGAIIAMIALLLWPVFVKWAWLVKGVRFMKKKDQPPQPVQVFALPAPAFCILTALTATLIHAFGDCPLRSPAILTLFLVALAAIPGFLPKRT